MSGRLITPSRPDYWRGTPSEKGGYTVEQLTELDKRRRKLSAIWRTGKVPREYVVIRIIEPTSLEGLPSRARFPCPAVNISRDGKRICVIAPNGEETWVDLK